MPGLGVPLEGEDKLPPLVLLLTVSKIHYRVGTDGAVCGFDIRLSGHHVALEAAHIKWHQAGGPSTEANGLALCTLHHKLFDRGTFTLSESRRVTVSEHTHGTIGFNEWLMAFHGKPIRSPQRPTYVADTQFINWHVREVFRGPSRYAEDVT